MNEIVSVHGYIKLVYNKNLQIFSLEKILLLDILILCLITDYLLLLTSFTSYPSSQIASQESATSNFEDSDKGYIIIQKSKLAKFLSRLFDYLCSLLDD